MVTARSLPSRNDRARTLLTRAAAEGDAPVSRIGLVNVQAGLGHAREPQRRQWLEAWQVLERAGLVCPTLENPKRGDSWFVTSTGHSALQHDLEGEL